MTSLRPLLLRALPLPLLLAGLFTAWSLAQGKAAPTLAPPEPEPPVVRALRVQRRDFRPIVRTHGTVEPRTATTLVAEVSGTVVSVSPALAAGGFFEKGEVLLRMDETNHRLALEQAKGLVAQRKSEAELAKRELERARNLHQQSIASSADLHRASKDERVARARLTQARSTLGRARADLERTVVTAPYEGRVREKFVELGQLLRRGTKLARVYAVDYADVRLPVPDRELGSLDVPIRYRGGERSVEGPAVTLTGDYAGRRGRWSGRVVRTEGHIEPRSRMLHLVARIEDPFGRKEGSDAPPLALNLFVEAAIEGRPLHDVAVLPRSALRGEDGVLVVGPGDRLALRTVVVLWRGDGRVAIGEGLEDGALVSLSNRDLAAEGTRVRAVVRELSELRRRPEDSRP